MGTHTNTHVCKPPPHPPHLHPHPHTGTRPSSCTAFLSCTCEHFQSPGQSVAGVPHVGVVWAERLSDDLSQDRQQQVCSRLQVRLLATQDFLRSKGGKTQAAVNKTGKGEAAERDRKTQATFRLVFTHTLFMKLSFLSLSLKDKRVNQRCQKTHNSAAKQQGHTLHPPITTFTSQHTHFRKSNVETEPQATPIHPLTSYTSFKKSSPHPLASDSHPPT